MRFNKTAAVRLVLATVVLGLLTVPAFAGGPLAVCQSGQAFLWPGGGSNIVFNPDQGDLGPLTNAAAVSLVGDAFQVWEDIPTSTLSYTAGALLPVDVDVTNFNPYLNPVAPDGLSAVVFDDTGDIFDLLFGSGTGILGFAGPEWVLPGTCEILEGVSFLNGPSFGNPTAALDVMVHEFGHWSNFAHTVVNGQIYLGSVGGDNTGPTPNDTFGAPPNPFTDVVETMYPFYYGPGIGTGSVAADDIAIASTMYPEPGFFADSGTIAGTILFGGSKQTGVNVIARNVADPFFDAVSAISSDFTDSIAQADPNVGVYTINGLTPGADYAVYVDEILAGGFSTTLQTPLPGPEDLYNGASESSDPGIDDPSVFEAVASIAGSPATGIDILFNTPGEGDPLPVGDDGSVLLPLPFTFCLSGQEFGSVYVNANGNLTFGAANSDFSESDAEMLSGPPRVAGVWRDLNPSQGGTVSYSTTSDSMTVTWDAVPEWFATGSNTFDITLRDNGKDCSDADSDSDSDSGDSDSGDSDSGKKSKADIEITYRGLFSLDGISGVSGGTAVTSGFETESDLSVLGNNGSKKIKLDKDAAVFENFADTGNDLDGTTVKFDKVGKAFKDKFEKNNSLEKAKKVSLPFDTINTNKAFTKIEPAGGDVDFFRFKKKLRAGTTLVAEVLTGQIDSLMGVFQCEIDEADSDDSDSGDSDSGSDSDSGDSDSGKCRTNSAVLVAANDDSNGLLSRVVYEVPADGTYALAVTTWPDFGFTGAGNTDPVFGQGRYVLDVIVVDGILLTLGDDNSVNVPFAFDFPFQGGIWNDVWVNSNGSLTFGAGDSDFSESVGELLSGSPRIAPLWDDLSPNNGGMVVAKEEASSLRVDFLEVPEFLNTGANSFSVTLSSDGSYSIDYGAVSAVDGLVGSTEGGGAADPGETDLSAAGPLPAVGTTYELFGFGDPFDLPFASLLFMP